MSAGSRKHGLGSGDASYIGEISVTLNTYTHLKLDDAKKEMEKLALKAADAEEEMEKLGVKENEHSVIKMRKSS